MQRIEWSEKKGGLPIFPHPQRLQAFFPCCFTLPELYNSQEIIKLFNFIIIIKFKIKFILNYNN